MYQVIYGAYDKSKNNPYGESIDSKSEAENNATNLYNEYRQDIDWTDIEEIIK